jgi:hypothetical protein
LTSAIEPLRQIGAKRNESGSLASQSRDKLAQELRLAPNQLSWPNFASSYEPMGQQDHAQNRDRCGVANHYLVGNHFLTPAPGRTAIR